MSALIAMTSSLLRKFSKRTKPFRLYSRRLSRVIIGESKNWRSEKDSLESKIRATCRPSVLRVFDPIMGFPLKDLACVSGDKIQYGTFMIVTKDFMRGIHFFVRLCVVSFT